METALIILAILISLVLVLAFPIILWIASKTKVPPRKPRNLDFIRGSIQASLDESEKRKSEED